ncbi:MAG: HNH endonuclease [Actinobacteria bacterium]|nr:HNH endonuclease [Actinomycetota bacterium]
MSTECEIWTKGTTGGGFSAMKKGGRTVYVRRVLWEARHGPIPEQMTVRSRCGNRLCVNPDHLYLDRPGCLDAPKIDGRFAKKDVDRTDPRAS